MKIEDDFKRWIVRKLVESGEDPDAAAAIADITVAAAKLGVFDPGEDWTDRVLKWMSEAFADEAG